MRNTTVIGRIAALVALAIVAVVLIVFSGSSAYHVYAIFQDASQLVNGDQVDVAQAPIGADRGRERGQGGLHAGSHCISS